MNKDFSIQNVLAEMEKRKRERARTKKPSLLDRVGIKDFPIPEELRKKNVPKEDPNVISEEKIGDYDISIIRMDYDDKTHDYLISVGDGIDPFGEMLKEDDFEQAIKIYLSITDYLKNQLNPSTTK